MSAEEAQAKSLLVAMRVTRGVDVREHCVAPFGTTGVLGWIRYRKIPPLYPTPQRDDGTVLARGNSHPRERTPPSPGFSRTGRRSRVSSPESQEVVSSPIASS